MKRLLRALSFFRDDTPRIVVVGVLLLASIGASLLKPWPLALIVDHVIGSKPQPSWLRHLAPGENKVALLTTLAIFTLALHFGQGALSAAQNFLSIKIGLQGLRRVRNAVFCSLQRLSLRFHQKSQTGDLIYRASWDTYSFQTLFQQGLISLLTALLSLVLMLAIMWKLNHSLALVATGLVPLLLFSIKVFGKRMRDRGVAAQQADSQVLSLVEQNISAHQLIQSYTREQMEEETFLKQTEVAQTKRLSQHGWELLYWLGISVVFAVGTAAILWLGSRQVMEGKLTIGELLVFVAYLAQLYDPLNQLSHVGATVSTAGAGTQRVFEILDSCENVKEVPNARPLLSNRANLGNPASGVEAPAPRPVILEGNLEFNSVSFGYEPNKPVLREVTFSVRSGESLAIIGPSGSGKTTLLNLVPRFFDVTSGSVRLEGVDVRELRVKDLRASIALVLQEPVLVPGTVAENIAFARPDASQEQITAAAHSANAHDFVLKLPQGYNTPIGEGAAMLSLGERQRLNLARAFLKDAPILLLDEPTSALDDENENLVMASLTRLMKGRTTLIVAHRLTTIENVHRVLVLQDGRVVRLGTPEEVLAKRLG
ncbi:MAG: Xenobiotic-transporting ATPase [Verrucomicrobiales bacterium]|nr:Xenobiotic-transporting ATPase [Verrucomicrobiales bacterium]